MRRVKWPTIFVKEVVWNETLMQIERVWGLDKDFEAYFSSLTGKKWLNWKGRPQRLKPRGHGGTLVGTAEAVPLSQNSFSAALSLCA